MSFDATDTSDEYHGSYEIIEVTHCCYKETCDETAKIESESKVGVVERSDEPSVVGHYAGSVMLLCSAMVECNSKTAGSPDKPEMAMRGEDAAYGKFDFETHSSVRECVGPVFEERVAAEDLCNGRALGTMVGRYAPVAFDTALSL